MLVADDAEVRGKAPGVPIVPFVPGGNRQLKAMRTPTLSMVSEFLCGGVVVVILEALPGHWSAQWPTSQYKVHPEQKQFHPLRKNSSGKKFERKRSTFVVVCRLSGFG
jgi:hypothetical protein